MVSFNKKELNWEMFHIGRRLIILEKGKLNLLTFQLTRG